MEGGIPGVTAGLGQGFVAQKVDRLTVEPGDLVMAQGPVPGFNLMAGLQEARGEGPPHESGPSDHQNFHACGSIHV